MMSLQNAREIALDKLQRGEISAEQANVLMVQLEGVRIVKAKIPADVRRALNNAVKEGVLGHIKKDGMKPEVYYHIHSRAKALDEREREFRTSLTAISAICTNG